MSAEALQHHTVQKVRDRIEDYAGELCELADAPLDRLRFSQGVIAGLREALELQRAAYKEMGQ